MFGLTTHELIDVILIVLWGAIVGGLAVWVVLLHRSHQAHRTLLHSLQRQLTALQSPLPDPVESRSIYVQEHQREAATQPAPLQGIGLK